MRRAKYGRFIALLTIKIEIVRLQSQCNRLVVRVMLQVSRSVHDDDEKAKRDVHKPRGMDAPALRPPSVAFSDRRSDKWAFGSERSHGTLHKGPKWSRGAYQGLVEEIDRFDRGLREECGERPPLADGQRSDVIPRAAGRDAVELLQGGSTNDVEDELQLVAVVPPREQRTAGQHLGKYAAHGPDVDGLRCR